MTADERSRYLGPIAQASDDALHLLSVWAHIRELKTLSPERKDEVVTALLGMVRDDAEPIRRQAIWALGTFTGTIRRRAAETLPVLIRALWHDAESVREKAAAALGNMGPDARDAVPDLVLAVGDAGHFTRVSIDEALKKIGPAADDALTSLLRAFRSENTDVRKAAAVALADMGRPDAKGVAAPPDGH